MPKKLLLAEDSLTIRKVFELALSRSDIAITAVDNGEDAVRLAGEIFPDLVVADLTLPGKNGFAIAAELRAMEKTEKIPVLILSGTLVPLDEARFKASGARGVLFKPFESRELLENIERLFREEAQVAESRKPQEVPAVDERWDFSDVMDEVEAEAGKSPATAPAAREGLLPGAILSGGGQGPPNLERVRCLDRRDRRGLERILHGAAPACSEGRPRGTRLPCGFSAARDRSFAGTGRCGGDR